MARQHGYFLLIPAFVPVDKNSLQNQLAAGQVIHEAAQKRDLSAIMALEGIRYHAQYGRDGAVKDLHVRWGSKDIGETAPEVEDETSAEETRVAYDEERDELGAAISADEPVEESASARKRREARERAAA